MQAGQTVLVRVKAATAEGSVARDGSAVAEFWAPGRDPQAVPETLVSPDWTVPCTWKEELRAFCAQVDTSGWAAGTWTVRGLAVSETSGGLAKGWSWGTFALAA